MNFFEVSTIVPSSRVHPTQSPMIFPCPRLSPSVCAAAFALSDSYFVPSDSHAVAVLACQLNFFVVLRPTCSSTLKSISGSMRFCWTKTAVARRSGSVIIDTTSSLSESFAHSTGQCGAFRDCILNASSSTAKKHLGQI